MNVWIAGARPRTLPAAVVPVAVGTACVAGVGDVIAWRVAAAAVVSLALQVGTNFANDFSDGVRGTDTNRVGPMRLVASGAASAAAVKRAAVLAFVVAAGTGTTLAIAVGPELFVVGALAIAAGWFYTGGPKPYGYLGLGEIFVFVFFGLVATAGSTYVQLGQVTSLSLSASVPVGFLACALLVVNNLRDIATDAVSGKMTLAVRLGELHTRMLFALLMLGALIVAMACGFTRPGAFAVILVALVAIGPVMMVVQGARGKDLIDVLGATARVQLAFGLVFSLGLWLTA